MTAAEVQARGLERIARGDWDDTEDAYQQVKLYAGWLLRQTGNQDETAECGCGLPNCQECRPASGWHDYTPAATEPGEPDRRNCGK